MNKGLSDKLLAQFPDISLVERPVLIDRRIINGNWLAGFTLFFFSFATFFFSSNFYEITSKKKNKSSNESWAKEKK